MLSLIYRVSTTNITIIFLERLKNFISGFMYTINIIKNLYYQSKRHLNNRHTKITLLSLCDDDVVYHEGNMVHHVKPYMITEIQKEFLK